MENGRGIFYFRNGFLYFLFVFLFIGGIASLRDGVGAQTEDPREYQIKAGFIYNFGKFVEWPQSVFSGSSFSICVLGKDPFKEDLDSVLSGKSMKERPLAIERVGDIEQVVHCHILFVGSAEEKRFSEVLAAVGDKSILTVGEGKNFNRNGGMIQFVVKDNKVRFSINIQAVEKAKLKMSSQLLKIAVQE